MNPDLIQDLFEEAGAEIVYADGIGAWYWRWGGRNSNDHYAQWFKTQDDGRAHFVNESREYRELARARNRAWRD